MTLVGRGAGRVLQFATMVVLARALGPRAFGAFALGWIIVRTLAYLATLGVELGAIHFGAAHHPNDPGAHKALLVACAVATCITSALLAAALGGAASFVHASFLADAEVARVLSWFALGLVPMALLIVLSAATRVGTSGVHATLTEDVLQPLTCIVGVACVVRSGGGVSGAVMAFDASFVVASIAAAAAVVRVFPSVARAAARPRVAVGALLSYSVVAAVPSRLNLVFGWVDRLVVGHLRPPADVGVYQALSQCAMHVPIVLGAVGAGLAPAIAVEHHRSDVGAMANAFDATTRWALVICLPWSAVLIVAPDVVLAVLFGARYAGPEAAAALRLIAAGQLVNAATGVPGVLLAMTGRAGSWAIATGVALLAAVAGSALLVPRFGILGAAAATSASTAALNALGVVLARRVLGRWPYDRRTVLVVLSGAASAAGVLGVRALPLRPPAALAACVVVALAVVFGALAAAGFDADARELVRSLRRRRGAA